MRVFEWLNFNPGGLMLIENLAGNYNFLAADIPYSAGVGAQPGYEIIPRDSYAVMKLIPVVELETGISQELNG